MRILPRAGAPWILAALFILVGFVLFAGGVQLTLLGGSVYYAATGIAFVASGLLLWRGRRSGMWLYAAMLLWTLIWALWEVGVDGWALASRLLAPLVLGLWFCLPRVRRGLS